MQSKQNGWKWIVTKTKWKEILFCLDKMCTIKCSRNNILQQLYRVGASLVVWSTSLTTYNCNVYLHLLSSSLYILFYLPFVRFPYLYDFISAHFSFCLFLAFSCIWLLLNSSLSLHFIAMPFTICCFVLCYHCIFFVLLFLTCQSWCGRQLVCLSTLTLSLLNVFKKHLQYHSTMVYSICTYVEIFLINLLKCIRVNTKQYKV